MPSFVAVGPESELTPWVARYGQDPYPTVRGSIAAPVDSAVCSPAPNLG